MKKLVLISTVVAVALAAVAVAVAAPERRFSLGPLNGSKTTGTGTLRGLGAETALAVKLRRLAPGKDFRMVLGTGTCSQRRGPFWAVGGGQARPDGTGVASALVHNKGFPVAFKKVADGKHIVLVFRATRAVACGLIPA